MYIRTYIPRRMHGVIKNVTILYACEIHVYVQYQLVILLYIVVACMTAVQRLSRSVFMHELCMYLCANYAHSMYSFSNCVCNYAQIVFAPMLKPCMYLFSNCVCMCANRVCIYANCGCTYAQIFDVLMRKLCMYLCSKVVYWYITHS
jgi:hypothetical protein